MHRPEDIAPAFLDMTKNGDQALLAMATFVLYLYRQEIVTLSAKQAFGTQAEQLVTIWVGRPRLAVLSGLAILHPMRHLGEAATVRAADGFGSGISGAPNPRDPRNRCWR